MEAMEAMATVSVAVVLALEPLQKFPILQDFQIEVPFANENGLALSNKGKISGWKIALPGLKSHKF